MSYTIFTRDYDIVDHARDAIAAYIAGADPEVQGVLPERLAKALFTDLPTGTSLAGTRTDPVTILIDMSGSMRGKRIWNTVRAVAHVGFLLEAAGRPFEVLGFTTRSWKGGQPRAEWLAAGRPKQPGRLCELRHVVFKAFDERWEDNAINLSFALLEGTLKENIDGEAIDWAVSRMPSAPGGSAGLVFISDGAPVDDATLSVNPADFLKNDLVRKLARIRETGIPFAALNVSDTVLDHLPGAAPLVDRRADSGPDANVVAEALAAALQGLPEAAHAG